MNNKIEIGYIIVSNKITIDGQSIGYFYREKPDNAKDSGWRFFSGEETQEYADEPSNFAMYNASTIVKLEPSIAQFLGNDSPAAFELVNGDFVELNEE